MGVGTRDNQERKKGVVVPDQRGASVKGGKPNFTEKLGAGLKRNEP